MSLPITEHHLVEVRRYVSKNPYCQIRVHTGCVASRNVEALGEE